MLKARDYEEAVDLRRLCELTAESDDAPLHAGDVQLKLCDPSLDLRRDARVWEDEGGIVGFAFVQPSSADFNFVVGECARRAEVESRIMAWAATRFAEAAADRQRTAYFFTSAHESDARRDALLMRHGFAPDGARFVRMRHPLEGFIPAPELPAGFTLRPLAGEHELTEYTAAHRNAFWAENFSEEWHRRVLAAPFYTPELNLVVTAPDETFAAFCFSWIEPRRAAPSAPLRAYMQTLGTRPRFRKLGLGRALFFESLRRFQQLGAREGFGVADAANGEALRLYESGGTRPLHKIQRYVRAVSD